MKFLLWPVYYLGVYCLVSTYFEIFSSYLPLLISNLIPLCSEYRHMIYILLNVFRWVLYIECGLSRWIFHESLRKMYILLLDQVSYRYQSYRVDWWCCWVQLCSYWFSACWIYPFSLQFCQFLLHVVWHPVVRCIWVKNCCCLFEELTPLSLCNTLLHPW